MKNFDVGETVICSAEVKRAGAYLDPDAIVISIYNPAGTIVVTEQPMVKNEAGKYQYDWDSAGQSKGYWRVVILVTYGGRKTILNGGYTLH